MTAEAAQRARKARREALFLLPLAIGLIVLWHYREDLFGTDVPVRIATAVLLAVSDGDWRATSAGPWARGCCGASTPGPLQRSASSSSSGLCSVVTMVALRIVDLQPRAIALGGAVTAVVLGLAAQSTIGNVIAGLVLIAVAPVSRRRPGPAPERPARERTSRARSPASD